MLIPKHVIGTLSDGPWLMMDCLVAWLNSLYSFEQYLMIHSLYLYKQLGSEAGLKICFHRQKQWNLSNYLPTNTIKLKGPWVEELPSLLMKAPLETLMVREDLTTSAPQLHGLLPSSAENEQPWGTDPVGLSLLLKLQQCGASASRTSFETSLPCLSEVGASFVSLLLFLSCFLKLGHPGTSA